MTSASSKLRAVALVIGLSTPAALLTTLPAQSQTAPSGSAAASGSAGGAYPNGMVVHFGDSFVASGLQQTLRPKFRATGTNYMAFGTTKAWLSTWAYGDLDNLYWGFRPSMFLITLGANELEFKPPEKRAYLVHEIVKKLRGTPCVWISIPLWKGAGNGLVEMTRQECKPCRHFDSAVVADQMTRQPDGRHPDAQGGALWAETFWTWLQKERDPSKGFWALKPPPPEEHGLRP